ncbi:hypothetical protein [Desulfosarcina cetonica]|uniref:hypothetical protein n=1 Tax=Desulfosarcina cetonica TaxID=90730 RepID=UPI0006D181BD|nr:hypothetical protein [Desulfosarcina cetonica]
MARLGYAVHDADAGANAQADLRRELIRLVITALLSANVMMLSWALYAGFFTDLSGDAVSKISLPIVLMATAAFLYGGGPMLRKAWFGLVHLRRAWRPWWAWPPVAPMCTASSTG